MVIPFYHLQLNCFAKLAFVLLLVFCMNQLLNPSLPLFPYFGAHQSDSFTSDLRGGIYFQDSPWKTEIGTWLSACHSQSKQVIISETISGKSCTNKCSGRGVCNRQTGECRCSLGFTGEQCSQKLNLSCNFPSTPELPHAKWVYSICSTQCDTTMAKCFCGEESKYPQRPVHGSSGFKLKFPTEPGGFKTTDFTASDEDIFTTNGSKHGWCNVNPDEAYAGKVKFKKECSCPYDGFAGRFCEVPVESFCINQCSGHGHCRQGFCLCDDGWYGSDCSVPSVEVSPKEWPEWILPAKIESSQDNLKKTAISKKKRPLIYVYDLPPDFNSLLLEGRISKTHCVQRVYNYLNETQWNDFLYGSQIALYESILVSPHRTTNGDEADFFFVPVLDSCIISRAFETPYLRRNVPEGFRSHLTLEFFKEAHSHISESYPFWNRSSGKDHIWFFSWDEGACFATKEIWNSTMVVHWGNTNLKHNHSTTAYIYDNWDGISADKRGNHPCFDPAKDIVIPVWKTPDATTMTKRLWKRSLKERTTLFYFNGNLGPNFTNGRVEDSYSMGIREKVALEFGSEMNKEGKLGRQHEKDVVVVSQRSPKYFEELASSVFCGVFPGDGWSGRMEDSILQGCIPVIIQDGIFLPYENFLNYNSFAVRLAEDDIPNLIKTLRGYNYSEIQFKKENVEKIWQRFVYHDNVMLEAKRQEAKLQRSHDWAVQFSLLDKDDVFATFIQILHYKLHNDPWRQQFGHYWKKDYGLPQECISLKI